MHVQVDQSGKVEYTRQNTVLAFSNGERFAVLIPAQVKRACIDKLRSRGIRPPRLQAMLFATALYFLLREHIDSLSLITIDVEYVGNSSFIKEHLVNLCRRAGLNIEQEKIRFGYIGKHSPAHQVAIDTFRGKCKPDRVIAEKDLLGEL